MLHALTHPDLDQQLTEARAVLQARFDRLSAALAAAQSDRLRPYPFNSGVFAMVGLPDDLDSEEVRKRLIAEQSLGLVRLGGLNALRIAWCSVAEEDIDGLVGALVEGLG